MVIKKTVIVKEEVTIKIDDKKVSVSEDTEKEIETLKAFAEVIERVLNLNRNDQ